MRTTDDNMLTRLRRIVSEFTSEHDLPHALHLLVTRVNEALHADATSVFLIDEASGEYVLMATVGLNEKVVGKARLKFGEGLVGLVGEREEPINIDEATEHEAFHRMPKLEQDDYHGFLGAPLIFKGELMGVVVVQMQSSRMFAEEEEAFLVTLAVQVAGELYQAYAKGGLQLLLAKRGRKKIEKVITGVSGSPGIAI
ncbi:unnamed protein product, partial [marine sediment metagenome]